MQQRAGRPRGRGWFDMLAGHVRGGHVRITRKLKILRLCDRLAMTAALEDVPWTRFSLEIQSRLLRFWSISFFFLFFFTFWNNATCKFEVILICVLLAVCVSLFFFFCGCIEINGMRNYVVLYMRYCKFLRDGSF